MKTYQRIGWSFLLVAAWLLTGMSGQAARTNLVEVRNFFYAPSNLVVNPGDTVLWTNRSATTHDVTHGTKAGTNNPPAWARANLAGGNGRFSLVFSNLGAFPYVCAQHVLVPNPPGTNQTGLVTVVTANFAPTIAITSPADVSRFQAPASFEITANAADSDGTVTNVQFFAGNTLLGADNVSPFAFSAVGFTNGVYSLTARAFDNLGGSSTSAVVNVVVNTTHTVNVGGDGTSFVPNALSVIVGDTVLFNGLGGFHTVTGDTVAEPFCGTEFPPTCQVTFNTAGTFAYHCAPHQALGMTGTITVTSSVNFRPVAVLTKPANGTVFAAPATFELTAEASDFGGSVTQVRFVRNGGISIGTDATSPYVGIVTSLAVGNYVLTALATDNAGVISTSAPVNISVVTPVPIQLSAPASLPLGFQFNYSANPGLTYVVEGSANSDSPTPFISISTNVAASNVVTFTDPAPVIQSNRVYRVLRQP